MPERTWILLQRSPMKISVPQLIAAGFVFTAFFAVGRLSGPTKNPPAPPEFQEEDVAAHRIYSSTMVARAHSDPASLPALIEEVRAKYVGWEHYELSCEMMAEASAANFEAYFAYCKTLPEGIFKAEAASYLLRAAPPDKQKEAQEWARRMSPLHAAMAGQDVYAKW